MRKRFGVAAQLYALRRAARTAATRGSATSRRSRSPPRRRAPPGRPISASARCTCCSRATASGRAPTIPPIAASSIRSSSTRSTAPACRATRRSTPRSRRLAPAFAAAASTRTVDYEAVWRAKRAALEAWSAAFARARAARPGDPLIADYHALRESGRRSAAALRRLPGDRRAGRPARTGGCGRKTCATANPRRSTRRSSATARASNSLFSASGSPTASSGARRSARADAASRSASIATSRSARRRTERKSWAHDAHSRARRHDRRAARSVFRPRARTGTCRRRTRSPARARAGRRSARVYRANMRHAGMLRIDHAMGLQRLFLIPAGAKPAEGAYLSYPLDDLIGHIALESQRAQCMVIGEDLGTVPEGFRDRMTRANIQGMRVLWFERDGPQVRPPAVLSAALGRLRRHPRSGDARRLVARRRHRRAALARPPDPGQGRRGDRPAARGEARPHRRARRRRPDRLGPDDEAARSPTPSPPPSMRSSAAPARSSRHAQFDDPRRRGRRDQPARNRPRAAELAPQGRPRRRRRLRGHRAQAILAALAKGRT